MATTLNLGNIKGDTGDVGPIGLTPVITANTGANVPVDTQGTATADTTDPDNPIITFGLPTGATGATPVITASATALANGETPTATADTTDPANPSIAFGIPAGDQGIQGETGAQGPAGSASIFLTENLAIPLRTTRVGAGDVGLTPPQYKVYTDAHGSTNGLCRFYTGGTVTGNAWISGGAALVDTTVPGSMVLSTFDNNGVPWTPTANTTYVFTNATGGIFTLNLGVQVTTGLPDAAFFANVGLTAWRTVTTTFTGVDASVDVGELNTINMTVATAGQTFTQGAFTLDNQTTPASLYIKRSLGSVTTATDRASLPDVNTADFQPITLP